MRRRAALFGIVSTFHFPLGATAQETPQRVAPGIVSTDEGEAFPALSPDGGTLWFSTLHHPDVVVAGISTRAPEYHPSPTASGALYFASFDRPGGRGRSDLCRSRGG
jgi:hypothetical protein